MSVAKEEIEMEREGLNFFLKQVDPCVVAKNYLSGNLKLPAEKIKINQNNITPDIQCGDNAECHAYEYIDKSGTKVRSITLNHNNWVKGYNAGRKYICDWCRIEYNNYPLLLPLKMEREPPTLIFHGIGEYCCFECVLAGLKQQYFTSFYYRNSIYLESESLLRLMYYAFTGQDNLKASPEWKSHVKNGGILEDRDFYSNKHNYVMTPNIVLKPAKLVLN